MLSVISPRATQGRPRLFLALSLLTLSGAALSGCSNSKVGVGIATHINAFSGGNQSAQVGAALPAPLVVLVTDANGDPVSGAAVTFASTANGTVGSPTATTNADGKAQTSYVLGPLPGAQSVTATVAGVSVPANFTVTALVSTALSLVVVSGNSQDGPAGSQLQAALVVRVQDALGNAVNGATVVWTTTRGTLSTSTTTTGTNGQAQVTFTLPATAGVSTITANVSGTSTRVTLTATAT